MTDLIAAAREAYRVMELYCPNHQATTDLCEAIHNLPHDPVILPRALAIRVLSDVHIADAEFGITESDNAKELKAILGVKS